VKAQLKAIRKLVTNATLPAGMKHTLLWSFDRLPQLYIDLDRTYENRYCDQIVGVIGGMLKTLASPDAGPTAEGLATVLANRFRNVHDKHGIAVTLKKPSSY
jgi:hypothetical protein